MNSRKKQVSYNGEAKVSRYRPIPWFLPSLVTLIVLLVLFAFGLREQQLLLNKSIEDAIVQRAWTSQHVAKKIENTLQQTKDSSERLAIYLSSSLSDLAIDLSIKFDILFETFPDKSIRSIKEPFNAKSQAGVWLPANFQPTLREKSLLVKAKYSIEAYGLGAKQQPYVDTWFMPESGGIVIFWPNEENFIYQAKTDFSYTETPWMLPARPENNPNKESYWTNLSFDPVPQVWMLSAVAPIYLKGQWIGTVGHDIPLNNILAETELLNEQESSRFILTSSKQHVIASDIYVNELKNHTGDVKLAQLPDNRWEQVINLALKEDIANDLPKSYQLGNDLFLVSNIGSQNWLLVTSMPLSPITEETNRSFTNLKNIAIISIVLEILIVSFILAWGHRRNLAYVDDLKSIYAELKQEKLRYQNLVENVPSIVYRCKNDKDWTMSFINGACHLITGYSAEEIINNKKISFNELIHSEDREYVWNQVQETPNLNAQYELIFRIINKNGSTHWVLERGQYFKDEKDELYLEGVITDITRLKQAELELQNLNDELDDKVKERTSDLESLNQILSVQSSELKTSLIQLEQTQEQLIESEKIASLNNLVVGMAHELNTPLGNLLMLESSLEDQLNEIQKQFTQKTLKQSSLTNFFSMSKKTLVSFTECTQKMVMLSESFRSIAMEDKVHNRRSMNLKEQVDNAISVYVSQLKNKSIQVAVTIDSDITINCHSETIYQVFTHLILNSITHGFENKSSGKITISAKCSGGETVIYYSDNGHGIPERIEHNIFEPFTTNKRGLGSVGLGLNVVYNLVSEGLNGNIKYIKKAIGAEFKMIIPN